MAVGLTNSSGQSAPYQIGDTLTTARTDLGDNWLLCNGAFVSKTEYPNLPIDKPAFLTGAFNEQVESLTKTFETPIQYINNMYVVGYYLTLYYSTSLMDGWQTKSFSSFEGIVYGNGYWVVCNGRYINYATSLDGEWGQVDITSSNTSTLTSIAFADGFFVVVGLDGKAYYASDPTAEWTRISGISSSYDCCSVAYGNGYWVITIRNGSQSSGILYYTTDITGSLTSKTYSVSSGLNSSCNNNITFADNTFVISQVGTVAYFTDPTNISVQKSLSPGFYYSSIYYEGTWFFNNGCYTSDLSSDASSWGRNTNIGFNGYYVSQIPGYVALTGNAAGAVFSNLDNIVLPQISLDKTYTYIKAK